MIDTEGKGYITFEEFKLVMESTQNVVNYVDESGFLSSLT